MKKFLYIGMNLILIFLVGIGMNGGNDLSILLSGILIAIVLGNIKPNS